jgi:hypothetical protein
MVAMADMMAVVVMAGIVLTRRSRIMVMGRMRVGVKVMVVDLHTDSMSLASTMPMHTHRRRPGELEWNDEHEDQGNQAAHGGAF